jgi:hypothetical protein
VQAADERSCSSADLSLDQSYKSEQAALERAEPYLDQGEKAELEQLRAEVAVLREENMSLKQQNEMLWSLQMASSGEGGVDGGEEVGVGGQDCDAEREEGRGGPGEEVEGCGQGEGGEEGGGEGHECGDKKSNRSL